MERQLLALIAGALLVTCQTVPEPGADDKYTISMPNVKAQFIPYGATLTNLFVKDKSGNDVDVVLGYDDLAKDPGHPVYNSIPGRHVNRIGHDTSIAFSVSDASNSSLGMLSNLEASVTYSIANSTWNIKMVADDSSCNAHAPTAHLLQPRRVPKPQHGQDMEPHAIHPVLGALSIGKILIGSVGNINDFASTPDMQLGHATGQPGFKGNCGADGACEGYNGYWLVEDAPCNAVVAGLTSPFSGIKAELRTDQPGVMVYSCNWFDGTAALKSTQGLRESRNVTRSSCVALEAQD
ncbi:putative Galactose mutarotase-like domain-containing protein [Seiridium unicorne]|uniref:Galactose mutarotase-like domain-containing protein n=1 Tax=Seiridium unicorne TaxID=138068 RepID=A0ABR2VGF4_9PEZI